MHANNFLLWRSVSYGRASQRLKKDDWEMRKSRNKKETMGNLKGCYCFSFLLHLHLLSVLSPAWNKACFFTS